MRKISDYRHCNFYKSWRLTRLKASNFSLNKCGKDLKIIIFSRYKNTQLKHDNTTRCCRAPNTEIMLDKNINLFLSQPCWILLDARDLSAGLFASLKCEVWIHWLKNVYLSSVADQTLSHSCLSNYLTPLSRVIQHEHTKGCTPWVTPELFSCVKRDVDHLRRRNG